MKKLLCCFVMSLCAVVVSDLKADKEMDDPYKIESTNFLEITKNGAGRNLVVDAQEIKRGIKEFSEGDELGHTWEWQELHITYRVKLANEKDIFLTAIFADEGHLSSHIINASPMEEMLTAFNLQQGDQIEFRKATGLSRWEEELGHYHYFNVDRDGDSTDYQGYLKFSSEEKKDNEPKEINLVKINTN